MCWKAVSNSVPATCWGFMGPAFFMNDSSLSKDRIGSVAIPVSDLSRAPLVVLPWLARWMISSKWAVSPFSCLIGWTPLTTWIEGLVERRDAEQGMVILRMGQNDSCSMSHSITIQLQSTFKIYSKKCFQIQRVNISWNQPFSQYYNCLLWTRIVWLLVFPIEVYNNGNLQQTWLAVISWLSFLAYRFCSVRGGLVSAWEQTILEID